MADTKTVHATLTYTAGGREVSEALSATVPVAASIGDWLYDMMERAQEILAPTEAQNGDLRYRLDGTDKPLTRRERIADVWRNWTFRGTGYSGSRFIPNWDQAEHSGNGFILNWDRAAG